MASLNFNAASVAPMQSFTPIPAGEYIAQITDSSIKKNSNETGMLLNITWTILDGQFTNRKVFDRINVSHQDRKTEEIGQKKLSAICHAIGVMQLNDSNQLHGRPCKIDVTVRAKQEKVKGDPSQGYWDESNDIRGVSAVAFGSTMPMHGSVADQLTKQAGVMPGQPAAPWGQQPAAPAPAAAPWANKAA